MPLTNLFYEMMKKVENDTNIRSFSPGSVARALLEAYADTAIELHTILDAKIISSMVTVASGEMLDNIGALFNLSRKDYAYAQGPVVISIDKLFGKSLDDLKDLIAEKTGVRPDVLTIPSGTEIVSSGGNITFNTVVDVNLSDEEVIVDVISSRPGTYGNISSSVLTRFGTLPLDFLHITQYVTVRNTLPISGGDGIESDDNFRFRIVNAYTASSSGNITALRLAALSVPGVSDVIINNYEYGIGTVGIFVISETPIVSQGILNGVQAVVNQVSSAGERVIISAPDYRALDILVRLEFKPETKIGDKDGICLSVQRAIINYVNNLPVGADFIMTEMGSRIKEASSLIYDYALERFGAGTYNPKSGLITYYMPVLPENQSLDGIGKFITNERLVLVCY